MRSTKPLMDVDMFYTHIEKNPGITTKDLFDYFGVMYQAYRTKVLKDDGRFFHQKSKMTHWFTKPYADKNNIPAVTCCKKHRQNMASKRKLEARKASSRRSLNLLDSLMIPTN